jgi:hypothetical protein
VIANEVAGYLGVDKGMVLDRFRKDAVDRQEKTPDRPVIVLRPDERMLLIAVFSDDEIRDDVIRELRSVQSIAGFASRHIFQAVLALVDAGQRVSFDAVNARLEEADQHLLAEAVLRGDTEHSTEEVHAALKRVRLSDHQQETDQLKARIKELERQGRISEAMQLMAEQPRPSLITDATSPTRSATRRGVQ